MSSRMPDATDVAAWAGAGGMYITGRPQRPGLGPPARLVPAVRELADQIATYSAEVGIPVCLDPLAVLMERAAVRGFQRRGVVSCGGATRLLRSIDGYLALSLARTDDLDLLPAWLDIEHDGDRDETFAAIERATVNRPVRELVSAGAALGLPVARLGEVDLDAGDPVAASPLGEHRRAALDDVVVVDLSSLWAGPLCTRILSDAGATVYKVESTGRPDGARGDPEFFDLMNAGKRSVAIDFGTTAGRDQLGALIGAADVIVEGSRPRALEALGVGPSAFIGHGPAVWLSITGYGRTDSLQRVAFGDDAAVAGGAVVTDADGPCFCGDALADPISGLHGAAAILEALSVGSRWMLDLSMARCAAAVAGPTLDAADQRPLAPAAPPNRGAASALGAETAEALRWASTR